MRRFYREDYGSQMKKERTNKSLTKKYKGKTPLGSHRRSEEARTIVKTNRTTGR